MGRELAEDADFEAAFDGLFVQALHVARRVVGDAATAEDLAAEALARTYASWPKVRELPHREAWVMRVVANLAIDCVRRRRWVADAPAQERGTEAVTPDRIALIQALKTLPKRQREVLVLRHVADMSEIEVATALGISAGSVKTHHFRAVSEMRRTLGYLGGKEAVLGVV